mmetsp:Transcript_48152/g.138277  ORF Transcript_48152/g.138277 Transcript_48152/m.138277 type:complete len:298 (+) Transcript_48152:214-1107(+)
MFVHTEALVEDTHLDLQISCRSTQLAAAGLLAVLHRFGRARRMHHLVHLRAQLGIRLMPEEEVCRGDPSTDALEDLSGGVVRSIAVVIATRSVLAALQSIHVNLEIQVVVPPEHGDGNTQGHVHVQDVPRVLALSLIDEVPQLIVPDGGQPTIVSVQVVLEHDVFQHLLPVDFDDPLATQHGLDLDHVVLDEWATNHQLVGSCQAVSVLRALVAPLDVHLVALHNPELAVTIKRWSGAVKCLNVRVAPEQACLPPRCDFAGQSLYLLLGSDLLDDGGAGRRHRPQQDSRDGDHEQQP